MEPDPRTEERTFRLERRPQEGRDVITARPQERRPPEGEGRLARFPGDAALLQAASRSAGPPFLTRGLDRHALAALSSQAGSRHSRRPRPLRLCVMFTAEVLPPACPREEDPKPVLGPAQPLDTSTPSQTSE